MCSSRHPSGSPLLRQPRINDTLKKSELELESIFQSDIIVDITQPIDDETCQSLHQLLMVDHHDRMHFRKNKSYLGKDGKNYYFQHGIVRDSRYQNYFEIRNRTQYFSYGKIIEKVGACIVELTGIAFKKETYTVIMTELLNPLSLSEEAKPFFAALLVDCQNLKIQCSDLDEEGRKVHFKKGIEKLIFLDESGNIRSIIYLKLTCDLWKTPSTDYLQYEVCERELGSGTFAIVNESLYQLKISQLSLTYEIKSTAHAVKILSQTSKDKVLNEAGMMQRAGYFAQKNPTFFGNHQAYFIMKLFPGIDLFDYLSQALNDPDSLSAWQIALIARNIAFAIFKHFHIKNIIHHDLKPENIKINPHTLEIFILDVGLSSVSPSHSYCGSPLYLAPEKMTRVGPFTTASDIFSLGRIFNILFGGGPLSTYHNDNNQVDFVKLYYDLVHANHNMNLFILFNLNSDLTLDQKDVISKLIFRMLDPKPCHRPTISEVLKEIDNLIFDMRNKKRQQKGVLHHDYVIAYEAGIAVRNYLAEKSSYKIINYDPNNLKSLLYPFIAHELENLLNELLVTEFINTCQEKLFMGLKTKAQILKCVDDVIKSYCETHEALIAINNKLDELIQLTKTKKIYDQLKSNLDLMRLDAFHSIKHLHKYSLTLDHLVHVTSKMKKDISEMKKTFVFLHDKLYGSSFTPLRKAGLNQSKNQSQLFSTPKLSVRRSHPTKEVKKELYSTEHGSKRASY